MGQYKVYLQLQEADDYMKEGYFPEDKVLLLKTFILFYPNLTKSSCKLLLDIIENCAIYIKDTVCPGSKKRFNIFASENEVYTIY